MPRPRFSTLREQAQKYLEYNKASDFFASGMQYRMREEPGFDKYDRLLSDQTGATLFQYLQNEVKDSQDKTALLQTFQHDPHFAWLMFIEGYNHECRIMSRSTASQNPATALFDLSDDGKTVIGIKDKTIKHVVIPDGIEVIGRDAFRDNTIIESVVFPDSVKRIGFGTFFGCTSLKDLQFSKGLEVIEEWAFGACTSLQEVILPRGIQQVLEFAFKDCSSLENIVIPDGIQRLEYIAIGCSSLKSVHLQDKNPNIIFFDDFRNADRDHCVIYVPKGTEAKYRTNHHISEFKNIVGE